MAALNGTLTSQMSDDLDTENFPASSKLNADDLDMDAIGGNIPDVGGGTVPVQAPTAPQNDGTVFGVQQADIQARRQAIQDAIDRIQSRQQQPTAIEQQPLGLYSIIANRDPNHNVTNDIMNQDQMLSGIRQNRLDKSDDANLQGALAQNQFLGQDQENYLKQQQIHAMELWRQAQVAALQVRATNGGKPPAAVALANEIEKARNAGDTARVNLLERTAKLSGFDTGTPPEISANGQPTFGFDVSNTTQPVYKGMAANDALLLKNAQQNEPVADNIDTILNNMEPNLKNFDTGFGGQARLTADKALAILPGSPREDAATAGNNIDKASNDLATELGKFQYMPGMRGSVLGLQTILASKPGVDQMPQTNQNIVAGLRAKVNDYRLTNELAQQYREASPLKVTDANTFKLDNALKSMYPLESVDPKTGAVTFNKDNIQKIRDAIPDALANPQNYLNHPVAANNDQSVTLPSFTSKADKAFIALPSGSHFLDSQGNELVKK